MSQIVPIGALEAVHRRVHNDIFSFFPSVHRRREGLKMKKIPAKPLICPITSRKITFPAFFPYAP